MSKIIDIEARAMERDTYRPLFRLSDIDRRRDRKVVRMPNDGPGMTWDERVARSEALLAKVSRQKVKVEPYQSKKPYTPRNLEEAHRRNVAMLRAVLDGAICCPSVAKATGESQEALRHVIQRAIGRGLLIKGHVRSVEGRKIAPLTITPAGAALVAEAGK